jgi:flagellar motor switch protein FliN/FliY
MSGATKNEADFMNVVGDIASAAADMASASVQPVSFGQLGPPQSQSQSPQSQSLPPTDKRNLELLLDVSIPVAVEVGRAQLSLDEVLNLVPGSVVPLNKKSEEPVDLRVNGKLVARGEVVLVDDVYGLRITQIVDAAGRIESLR